MLAELYKQITHEDEERLLWEKEILAELEEGISEEMSGI